MYHPRPVVFCSKGRAGQNRNVWSGLPSYVSEFCADCGQGVQLPDGTFVFLVPEQYKRVLEYLSCYGIR